MTSSTESYPHDWRSSAIEGISIGLSSLAGVFDSRIERMQPSNRATAALCLPRGQPAPAGGGAPKESKKIYATDSRILPILLDSDILRDIQGQVHRLHPTG